MTKDEAAQIIVTLKGAYRRPDLADEVVIAYGTELMRLEDAPAAAEAVANLIRTEEFMPSVALIVAAYQEVLVERPSPILGLPPGAEEALAIAKIHHDYGENRDQWVYCVACKQVVSLEERDTDGSWYEDGRGWHHGECPAPGSRPVRPKR